ncbi:Testis-Expressed Protein 15 [Manis pentadactyla]|nr:Testis-Expressed Protein 15 [Manis pentadactyla]
MELTKPDKLPTGFCNDLYTGDSHVWSTSMPSFTLCFPDWLRWSGAAKDMCCVYCKGRIIHRFNFSPK